MLSNRLPSKMAMSASLPGSSEPMRVLQLQNLRRIDGDAAQRVLERKTVTDQQADGHRQHRGLGAGVGGEGDGHVRLLGQDAGGVKRAAVNLHLAGSGQVRADDAADLLFVEHVGNLVALGAVLDDVIKAELLGDADGGEDVVRAVGVHPAAHLAADNRDQRVRAGSLVPAPWTGRSRRP